MIKLFIELPIGTWFHFYDTPERKLLKSNGSHYISPEGRRTLNQFVAVFPDKMESATPRKSIYDQTKGDFDE